MAYAQVAVDSSAPEKTYTYAVPQGMPVSKGQAVWVPFGRESRLTQGFVFGFTDEPPPVPQIKALSARIEAQPLLSQVQCDLALWLSDYYFTPLFECAALMMPPGFRQRVRTTVRRTLTPVGEATGLSARAARVLALLETQEHPVELGMLRRRFGLNADALVEALARRGLADKDSRFERPRVGPKLQRVVALTEAGRAADLAELQWQRRPRQRAALQHLAQALTPVPLAELSAELDGAPAAVAALARQGLAEIAEAQVIRDPLAERTVQTAFPHTLTPAQEAAWQPLQDALLALPHTPLEPAPAFLLHGVTGSGKTELYLRALEVCVAQGKRAIVLVPEIALEPQTVARFSARFPGRVAVLHSGLSPGEAYDEWWRIRAGEFDVVIGSRSAVYAPQPDLGLIVIDEEHESTYKQQDPAPRYHARRVALELGRRAGAVVLLGSATPDIESYQLGREGAYRLLELAVRAPAAGPRPELALSNVEGSAEGLQSQAAGASASGLPPVEVVDLREELRAGNRSIFSRVLQVGLAETLRRGQQAILFLNRRGAATFVQCRDCGAVVRCRRCDTPLTYHSAQERLICHQCNGQRRVPTRCRDCGSARIRFLGVGTQRVQQEVESLLPAARVLRWDRDVTRARRAHQELLDRFSAHEADVLVGTQMVAKGLDLPRVTLVGVVNADVNLYLPDFRAAERTFQLLTQVAGRAGRGPWAGQVIIQTYTPEHYAIAAAARQDYGQFFGQEMAFRRQHGYPPAQPLVRLLFSDVQPQQAQRAAALYGRALAQERARAGMAEVAVLGPAPAFHRKVRGRYRWQVLLKGREAAALLGRCPPPRGWAVDVDPAHVL
ncbi:MAG: primosomal protein N' [Chloroflexi bacterium]|nr:primosomal protein N' [Chloroflexota bacterium]